MEEKTITAITTITTTTIIKRITKNNQSQVNKKKELSNKV
jgi:hypothetical protein